VLGKSNSIIGNLKESVLRPTKLRRTILQSAGKLESRWVVVNGLNMHALSAAVEAPERCTPVVFVHGLGVSGRYMVPTARKLMKDANVYVPDLPGFGRSSKPTHVFNIRELAETLSAWMQSVGLERAAFVGHSFGCQVVAELALRHPEKIASIVLAAPTVDPRARTTFSQLGCLIVNATREPLSLVPLVIRDYLRAGLMRAARTLQISLQDRVEDKLPRIEMPALVVRGSRDPIVPDRWATEVAGLLPQGKLVVIEGAAHALSYNSPEELGSLIREFLQRGPVE
jgi:2-hydroxy-6-oxonona-2,4-dienedioate hydrolase